MVLRASRLICCIFSLMRLFTSEAVYLLISNSSMTFYFNSSSSGDNLISHYCMRLLEPFLSLSYSNLVRCDSSLARDLAVLFPVVMVLVRRCFLDICELRLRSFLIGKSSFLARILPKWSLS